MFFKNYWRCIIPSLLELQDLYNEALVRELIEKTKSCALTWVHLGGNQFQAEETDTCKDPNVDWDFYLTKTTIGNASEKYNLDIKKDTISYVTIEAGPLPRTGRSSVVQELYEIVETIVLELDVKLKESLSFIQSLSDCRGGGGCG